MKTISAITDQELIMELEQRLNKSVPSQISSRELLLRIDHLSVRLREAEQMKSDFLSNIRNEIVNPLSALLGLSQALLSVESIKQVQHLALLLHQEAFDLDFQMRNLFAAAEIEANGFRPVSIQTDILSVVNLSIEAFTPRIQRKQLHVALNSSPEIEYITIDPALLHLIFSNVLANAIEFSSLGKSIIITLSKSQREFHLSIRDFGIGFDMANRENIFDRFKQLHTGTTKAYRGQGLGLSIVQECVDALGASMQVNSVVGHHTEFAFSFPVSLNPPLPGGISDSGNDVLFAPEEII
ncbi:MAG TPA: HAMP domain-containing sensor histidine kinase [Cyclobacteriaceae bacterium]|nr:HAMP domain-containing sensor histidine kinase [Cyclobacteriaceae bacterium]